MIWTAGRDNLANYFNTPWLELGDGLWRQKQEMDGRRASIPGDLPPCLGAFWSAFQATAIQFPAWHSLLIGCFDFALATARLRGQLDWVRTKQALEIEGFARTG